MISFIKGEKQLGIIDGTMNSSVYQMAIKKIFWSGPNHIFHLGNLHVAKCEKFCKEMNK